MQNNGAHTTQQTARGGFRKKLGEFDETSTYIEMKNNFRHERTIS